MYGANANLSAVSKPIDLTKVAKGSKLFLKLHGSFETEYFYDGVCVSVSEDGGEHFSKVYARTGVSNGEILDYAEFDQYVGKTVVLKLELESDGDVSGKGWDLSGLSIVSEGMNPQSKVAPSLRAAIATESYDMCSRVGKVVLHGVQWESNTEGIVAFSIKDENENFLTSDQFDVKDVSLLINGNEVGCKKPHKMEQPQIDVVYMIDNSGSMDDEQTIILNNIPTLTAALGTSYDAQAALYRFGFGQYSDCPFELVEEKGTNIWKIPSSDFDAIWRKNTASGSYEGYYAGMIDIAQRQLNYRRLSQKILIMMGDEDGVGTPSAPNEKDCSGAVCTKEQALDSLKGAGFQVFILQDPRNVNDFKYITDGTDGSFYNVTDTTQAYTMLMNKIAENLQKRLYMHFCTNPISCQNKQVPVELRVCSQNDFSTTTVDYPGAITRTAATVALESTGVDSLSAVTIAFEVENVCKEIESVEVNYSYVDDSHTIIADKQYATENDGIYSITIPAGLVHPKKIEYNIRVNYKDGIIAASSPSPNGVSGYTWTIPVKEALAPVVTDVEWTGAVSVACGQKTVSATVVDYDGEIADDENGGKKVYVFYSDYYPNKADYIYDKQQMLYDNALGKYVATLDKKVGSELGFVYYIFAEDNDGMKTPINLDTILYNKTPLSDSFETINIEPTNDCSRNYKSGDYIVAYYKGCNNAMVEVGRKVYDGGSMQIDIELALNKLQNVGGKNGLDEGDSILFVVYRKSVSDTYWQELAWSDSYLNGKIKVCPPSTPDKKLTLQGDGVTLSDGSVVRFAPARRARTFSVVNDSEDENDWIINSMKLSPAEAFRVSPSDIKNRTIPFGETFEFTVEYLGDEDAEADLYIFNNTLTDPFTLHLKGEAIKECTDELQNIRIFDNSTNVGIAIEGNQSVVDLDVRNQANQLRWEYNGYLGHGVQTFNVPTYSTDSLLRVVLTRDGDQCEKLIYLKDQNGEDPQLEEPQNSCEEWVQSLSVNTWGTLIDVDLKELTNLKIDVVNVGGSSTGVSFGPQLMGAGMHELYLGTDKLPASGVYLVTMQVNGKSCSMTMVNVK